MARNFGIETSRDASGAQPHPGSRIAPHGVERKSNIYYFQSTRVSPPEHGSDSLVKERESFLDHREVGAGLFFIFGVLLLPALIFFAAIFFYLAIGSPTWLNP